MLTLPSPYGKVELSGTELSPAVRVRLMAPQARLDLAGTKHIHISWNYESMALKKPSLDALATSVCQMFEGFLDGHVVPLEFSDGLDQLPDDIQAIISGTHLPA